MYMPLLVICLRLVSPFTLLHNNEWHPEQPPRWRSYGEFACGLVLAQTDATRFFVKQCYRGRTLSAAFGINFHLGKLTAGHLTGLRQLLLAAGDVESNPGPTTNEFVCNTCGKEFNELRTRNQHQKTVHGAKELRCEICGYETAQPSNLKRHIEGHTKAGPSRAAHQTLRTCDKCSYSSTRPSDVKRHMKCHDKAQPEPPTKRARVEESDEEIRKIVGTTLNRLVNKVSNREETALKQRLRIVDIDADGADPERFLSDVAPKIGDYVDHELEQKTGIKLQLLLSIQFHKELEPEKTIIRGFRTHQQAIFRGTEFNPTEEYPRILKAIDKFVKEESGWVITRLLNLKLYMASCRPLRGSSYRPLPSKLSKKRAIINVQNTDQKCFMWSILAKNYPAENNPHRVSNYKDYEQCLNMQGIDLPVSLIPGVGKFEKQNNFAVNVYGYDEKDGVHPLRISKEPDRPRVHLLLHDDHYSLITDLNRLLYDETKHQHKKFFCPMCLNHRSTQQLLDEHMDLCSKKEPTKVTLSDKEILKFTNTQRKLRQPLTIYADFECLTEEIDTCQPDPSNSYTQAYQKHTPCGYGMVQARGCCGVVEFADLEAERCRNPIARFLQSLMMAVIDYHGKPAAEMTDFDPTKHSSNECHICGEEIAEHKVRDHCHICGKYRGPAHNKCNQNLRLNRDVVVVFHNLRRYDGHLIMREIGKAAKLNGLELSVVAKAMEDYISFSLVHKKENYGKGGQQDFSYNIKFIDSVQFLNNSLSGLVNNLKKEQFNAMTTEFEGEHLNLLLRKGVYPYDYMNTWGRFEEKQLPPKEQFFSKLSGEHISQSDYEHAQKVWNTFNINNLGEYHDLYLKTDVLLLADVFENFRKFSLEKYGLDPCHYMTAPSLAWDACLKMTGVELEMLQDSDMYLFCELGIRGGISMISHRYAKANNPQMKDYDPTKPTSYIIYLDANNLYGWAMVQKLPVDGFHWVDDVNQDWADKRKAEGDKGYILEVDLEYPPELHDAHDQYPLAPETMEISLVSKYCEKLKAAMGLKIPPTKKLVPNLADKTKYILHIRNLQLYLRLGLKLKKVHRVLEFNQRAWMKDYIMFNTKMRAEATNDFDKNLLKLMNNAVFGKTMENVRKYRNIELVTSAARFEKLVASPRFQDSCKFTEDLVGVSSMRPSTCLNKPIYCGLTVLDLSKVLMYEFHYDYITKRYGRQSQVKLLFTDTDSLCYWVQTENIFSDMKADGDRFDFSDYSKDHPCYSAANKKVIGKMKDEATGKIIEEFAGLRPKMYSLYGPHLEPKKTAKGIKKKVVKTEISHQDYVDTLMNETYMHHEMHLLQNQLHEIFSVKMNKKTLCAYDDNRWLLNSIESRSHGHYLNGD